MAKRVDTTCRSKQKMETDRPHRSNSINNNSSSSISIGSGSCSNTTTTSELSICFTSRLSSSSYSSMKISSKSILSPGRPGEPSQTLLSSSLSRRLRSNGSMKGGQASPMFRTTTSSGKKRGCSFENPEPSSPKVTCIGQVRVKTKNKSKKITRTRSNRRREVNFKRLEQSNNIEASSNHQDCEQSHMNHQFANHHQQQQQECLSHRNQRWVHLPVLICEALRAFGAEFNCFLPCRSPCLASQKEKGDTAAPAAAGSSTGSSCGSVFARWLVSMQEGDGKGRGIELVVGEEEEDEEREESRQRSYRRHVFEEIEFKDENFEGGNKGLQEEEARVSICIPPKNALLLMRCRSDPVRMAALANKFWDAPVPRDDVDEEDEKEQQEDDEKEVPKGAKDGNEEEEEEEALKSGSSSQALALQVSQNFAKNPSQSPFPLITAVTTTLLLKDDCTAAEAWNRIRGEWNMVLMTDFFAGNMWVIAARGMPIAFPLLLPGLGGLAGSQRRRCVVRIRRPDFKAEKKSSGELDL
uniref:Uncharacterized protein n=2 Tax=Rhizophora mucronata TaxID=61149 RepID=A0A2P2IV08_RHIMU